MRSPTGTTGTAILKTGYCNLIYLLVSNLPGLKPLINYSVEYCEGDQAGVEGCNEFGLSFQLKTTVCSVSDNL